MSYKVCSRCSFIVPIKNKLCTTCGSNSFSAIDEGKLKVLPTGGLEDAREDYLEPREYQEAQQQSFTNIKVVEIPPAQPDRAAARRTGPHALRHKFHQYESSRPTSVFSWNGRR